MNRAYRAVTRPQTIKTALTGLIITFTVWGQTPGQNPPATHPDTVPIYHVTVVDRTVSAVNYKYKGGPTLIDFKGTVLLPKAKGEATVESKTGRTEIDAKFEHVDASQRFGPEYLTYVLWAITPDGHAINLGEVVANGSDKGRLRVTTELQAFGMIVTAEPYSSVRLPSDVVVLENAVRPDTEGNTEPIHARIELLPRGTYTFNVPGQDAKLTQGEKVSMSKYEQIVGIYQAQNAIQIAESQGAGQYAAELITKARQQLANARQLEARHAGRSEVVTAAREAAQTAEDARIMTLNRKQATETKQAVDQAARDKQLREEAEARAQQAEAQSRADRQALQNERPQPATSVAPPPPPPPPPPAPVQPQAYIEPHPDRNRTAMAERQNLLQELNKTGIEVLDTPRGVVVMLPDADFDGTRLSVPVAGVAQVLNRTPGAAVEVDGYADASGEASETVANARAQRVRDSLVESGLNAAVVTARNMGSGHPLGPDRDQNRRVEIVISGAAIGNAPLWDKSYSLNLSR
jgi:outer membrane protein OmpA-like peptidoglycan-associated protein